MKLTYDLPDHYLSELSDFPFESNLEDWEAFGVQTLSIRKGNSRHPVIFVKAPHSEKTQAYAIKETTPALAYKEWKNYIKLKELEIETLTPVGVVVREDEEIAVETPVGVMYEKNEVAYLITLLEETVLPESYLFSYRLARGARIEIFNAISELFANCHAKGVHWGDASLENVLVKFKREEYTLGKKRRLTAILSDTETTEIHPSLSLRSRESDIEFFFESMLWLDEEFTKRGIPRDRSITSEDIEYLKNRYNFLYSIFEAHKAFDKLTSFRSERHFGKFRSLSHPKVLLKHLEEHKWYLSERAKKEVTLREATIDWYVKLFLPLRETLSQSRFATFFPDKTELELYIEIMENKYYLSEKKGKDIGLSAAMQDYCNRFGVEKDFISVMKRMFKDLISITKDYSSLPMTSLQDKGA
ncbi:MAG: DUF4032 domain-containing protein [Chloroherpetonaceae bacterium]|nr:DUF4032 domain-containing protein [Chloroherpetonaceae bacterium]